MGYGLLRHAGLKKRILNFNIQVYSEAELNCIELDVGARA